jgi:hypothetical protein
VLSQALASVNNSQITAMPSSSLRVIVVCAALATWLPAQAQFLGPRLETNAELTKQDLDIIRHTVNEQVHGSRSAPPRNGEIRSRRIPARYRSSGNSCETASNARRSITDCYLSAGRPGILQPDGQWRLT